MPRSFAYACGLSLLVLVTSACGWFTRPPTLGLDSARTLLHCGVDGEVSDADADAASRALIDAARNDPDLLVDDELIIAYRPQRRGPLSLFARRPDSASAVRAAHGLTLRRSLAAGRELVVAADPLDAAERLLNDPDVLYAHPNLRLVSHAVRDDSAYDLDEARQWNLARFGVPQAWALEHGSPDVTVAIIDAGLDTGHPEFAGRLVPGWDFFGSDDDVATAARHGTHVAGIAAATGDDGFGVSGVAMAGVRILPIKVFDEGGLNADVVAVVDAIRWAAGIDVRTNGLSEPEPRAAPVQVINLSLGTPGTYLRVQELDAAIRDARDRGVIVVASVGNEGTEGGITSPGNSPCALAVTSVDESLEPSWFSNHDAETRLVDVSAPGGSSLDGRGIYSTFPGAGYGYEEGTSMAAPYVSGAIALLWSAHPEWSDTQVLERLLGTALLPAGGDPLELGFGVVCADAALGAETRCGR